MIILGLSFNNHDSSASLIINGRIIASSLEERFSGIKHDPFFPKRAINFCLKKAEISPKEIDLVAYHENPMKKFTRVLSYSLYQWPKSFHSFFTNMKQLITNEAWTKQRIADFLDIHPNKIEYIPHHLSHAAHAFYTSNFNQAAILSCDSVGEWSTCESFLANKDKSQHFKQLQSIFFPNSLGLVYSSFTSFLGFRANHDECTTMALAAFGEPVYAEDIRKIIQLKDNGAFIVDQSYFDFSDQSSLPVTDKFIDTFGLPRKAEDHLTFNVFADQKVNPSEKRYADIAASIQLILEEGLIHILSHLKAKTSINTLCLTGGVSLNCKAIARIIDSKIFSEVYVPDGPGDGGASLGAALYLANKNGQIIQNESFSPYLGAKIESSPIFDIIHHPQNIDKWKIRKIEIFKDEDLLINHVADEIMAGKIIAWAQGRSETGPRALGNRSILSLPQSVENALKISDSIKLRAHYRPYALSITPKCYNKIADPPHTANHLKWMQCTTKITPQYINEVKAGVHIDRTSRLQIVTELDNCIYYKLLKRIGRLNKIEALLNTSMNTKGAPIVNNSYEALHLFITTPIDILVVGNIVIHKQ